MMAHCSMAAKEGNLDRLIRKYAYELRFDNLSELELMLTKADLMSVKRNGAFWEKTSEKFKNISKMPARVKCAVLSWHTMETILDKALQNSQ